MEEARSLLLELQIPHPLALLVVTLLRPRRLSIRLLQEVQEEQEEIRSRRCSANPQQLVKHPRKLHRLRDQPVKEHQVQMLMPPPTLSLPYLLDLKLEVQTLSKYLACRP